jgi:putative transposase
VVITEDGQGKWWACLQIELEARPVPAPQAECIGIDVGLAHLLTLSNGEFVNPPHLLEQHIKELRILQRKLDRQRRANNPNNFNEDGTIKKGARNWHLSNHMADTQKKIAKLHAKIKEQRWYFWHTITDELTKRFSYIALEDLTLDFMQQNGRISRRTQDAAIGMFWRMLKNKAEERGVYLVWVNPKYTSQTCAHCGAIDADNRKTQAEFQCVSCGHQENADLNAARNILRRALNGEVQPPAALNVDRRSSVSREA